MCTGASDYVAYLLRLWQEDMNGTRTWRVALRDALTLEELHFADIEELIAFLQDRYSENVANPSDRRQMPVDDQGQIGRI